MTDPLEHSGEQQESYEMLEQHREVLAADAAEIAREQPNLPTVGLILHADASEAGPLRAALESASGQSFAGRCHRPPYESHSGSAKQSHRQFGQAEPPQFGEAEPPWFGHAEPPGFCQTGNLIQTG